jgi:hypothetical protein
MVYEVIEHYAYGTCQTLEEINKVLLKEFKNPKLESQYITELKEIK